MSITYYQEFTRGLIMSEFIKIDSDETKKRCSSPYGNETHVLTISDIFNLLCGNEIGLLNYDEYGLFLRLEKEGEQCNKNSIH